MAWWWFCSLLSVVLSICIFLDSLVRIEAKIKLWWKINQLFDAFCELSWGEYRDREQGWSKKQRLMDWSSTGLPRGLSSTNDMQCSTHDMHRWSHSKSSENFSDVAESSERFVWSNGSPNPRHGRMWRALLLATANSGVSRQCVIVHSQTMSISYNHQYDKNNENNEDNNNRNDYLKKGVVE